MSSIPGLFLLLHGQLGGFFLYPSTLTARSALPTLLFNAEKTRSPRPPRAPRESRHTGKHSHLQVPMDTLGSQATLNSLKISCNLRTWDSSLEVCLLVVH